MEIKKQVLIVGSFASRSGYGNHSRDIAHSFIDIGNYDVKLLPTQWGSTPNDALHPSNPRDLKLIERLIQPESITQKPDIFVQISIPNEFQPNGHFNIGITAGIETTQCKPEWIEGCNRMDCIIATSEHSKKVFELTKYEKRDSNSNAVVGALELQVPCHVLFEGVDLTVYKELTTDEKKNYIELNDELDTLAEPFAFLFCGHWLQGELGHDRKDVGALVKTFLETFKDRDVKNRPALILKTSGAGFSEIELFDIQHKINQIQQSVGVGRGGVYPTVKILYGDLTDDEMNALYNHKKIKAMISFTKGEGFGRPLLEFTTTGKPVIASNWSGQVDFLNPDHAFLLPGVVGQVHRSAANEWIMSESSWFTVDYNYASQLIRDLFDNYEKYLEKSKKHIGITKNNFSMEKMTEKLNEILSVLLREPTVDQSELTKIVLPKITVQ
jgi:glycosyltransferase involved in cell wall biosynthesis